MTGTVVFWRKRDTPLAMALADAPAPRGSLENTQALRPLKNTAYTVKVKHTTLAQ
jgi:hypothetical protein